MGFKIELDLDEIDAADVNAEFALRQKCRDAHGQVLPDGESNLAGAMVAEMVRDLREYRIMYDDETEIEQ